MFNLDRLAEGGQTKAGERPTGSDPVAQVERADVAMAETLGPVRKRSKALGSVTSSR